MALHVMHPTLLREGVGGIFAVDFVNGRRCWWYGGSLRQPEGEGPVDKRPVVESLGAVMAIRGGCV